MIERTITCDLWLSLHAWAGQGAARTVERRMVLTTDVKVVGLRCHRYWFRLDDQYDFAASSAGGSALNVPHVSYILHFMSEESSAAFTAFVDEYIAEKKL